jgi:ribose/xylose/arabinose/galactoside ABC-type transport system permease subunit
MKKNMGTTDRMIRIVAAFVIAGLLLTGQIEGVVATVLGVLAVVFFGTSLVSFCPLYLPFKISTRKEVSTQAR